MGHTHRCRLAFKKKNQVKSPSPESRVPETGSDPPIGSGRDSGRDTTSKIYKSHINGKPKRPGTHQYHYLGPTVVVVAEKLDPTVGQLCFHRNFQTVGNLQKGTTGMSLEGLKMVERSYGLAGNSRETR